MTKRNRAAALLVALSVLFAMLFSTLYIAAEAEHDCVGEGCPICERIEVCENTLHNLSFFVLSVAVAVMIPVIWVTAAKTFSSFVCSDTLVSLKVKLSN